MELDVLVEQVRDASERLAGVVCALEQALAEPLLNDLRWVADTLGAVEESLMSSAPKEPK